MINRIFTDEERQILELYLIKTKVNNDTLTKLIGKIETEKSLFDDVFLYLQVKKTITT